MEKIAPWAGKRMRMRRALTHASSPRCAQAGENGGMDRRRTGQASGQIARRRLRTGDVLFEKIRVLHARELDREAAFDVAHHPARGFAERDDDADLGAMLAADGCSRER